MMLERLIFRKIWLLAVGDYLLVEEKSRLVAKSWQPMAVLNDTLSFIFAVYEGAHL